MSIVLSSSVRQNLLSLQSTADLLATTQNRLSTGKKVNTALDNPTNFFTAQALDSRASDISNLLDGIGNGVQILQAANNGITSLQKLVDSAKSLANQALQTTVGFSTKSSVSTTVSGATSADLRGSTSFTNTTAVGNVLFKGTAGGTTPADSASTLGATLGTFTGTAAFAGDGSTALTAGVTLIAATANSATALVGNAQPVDGQTLNVNGHTITFKSGSAPAAAAVPAGSGVLGNLVTDGAGNTTVFLGTNAAPTATVGDLLSAVDLASGVKTATITAGVAAIAVSAGQTASLVAAGGLVTLHSSTGADLSVTGKADLLQALKVTTSVGGGSATVVANRSTSATSLGSLVTDGSTLNVDGHTITFKNAQTPAGASLPAGSGVNGNVVNDGTGNSTVYLQSATVADVLSAIDLATGVRVAANSAAGVATVTTAAGQTNSSINGSGIIQVSTGIRDDLAITATGNALSVFGLTGATSNATSFSAARTAAAGGINGKSLTFTSFNGGQAVNVTFGDGSAGSVKSLDQLNAVLQANNLAATLDASGKLTIAASNDFASSTLGSAASGGSARRQRSPPL